MLRLRKRSLLGLPLGLWLLLAFAVAVAAAILFQLQLTTTVQILGSEMQIELSYTDDDGIENNVGFDLGDTGTSDPLGIGPNAARSTSQLQTCTIVALGGGAFNFDLSSSYADGWCTAQVGLTNLSTQSDMVYQGLTNTLDPLQVEVIEVTAVGTVWVKDDGFGPYSQYVIFALHVLPGATPGAVAGQIQLDFASQ